MKPLNCYFGSNVWGIIYLIICEFNTTIYIHLYNYCRYCDKVVGNTDYYSDVESGHEDSLPPVITRPQKPSRRYHGSSRSQTPSPIRNMSRMRNTSSNQKMSNRTLSQTQPSSQQKTVTLLVFVNFTNDELSYNLF